ncbi:MAG TPA: hypothetical protein VLI05_02820 [Candidatus Saccharimonadia bacterium]|nr:hypothetical protein [Candidatus Saccharimonadia bacterium]
MTGLMVLLIIVNGAISTFNAWYVGNVWPERQEMPWPLRWVVYASVTMSACGFTWCYLMAVGLATEALRSNQLPVLHYVNDIPPSAINALMSLGYLAIILPVIGSGLVITAHAWSVAWRRRSFSNVAVAGWDSFAQIYNVIEAVEFIPEALSSVVNFFRSDDEEDWGYWVLVALLVLLIGGVLTTSLIVRLSARGHVRRVQARYQSRFA